MYFAIDNASYAITVAMWQAPTLHVKQEYTGPIDIKTVRHHIRTDKVDFERKYSVSGKIFVLAERLQRRNSVLCIMSANRCAFRY